MVHGFLLVVLLLAVQFLDVQRHEISCAGHDRPVQVVANGLVLAFKHVEVAELGVLGYELSALLRLVVFQVHIWQIKAAQKPLLHYAAYLSNGNLR